VYVQVDVVGVSVDHLKDATAISSDMLFHSNEQRKSGRCMCMCMCMCVYVYVYVYVLCICVCR